MGKSNERSTAAEEDAKMTVGPEIPEVPPMSKRLFLVRHGEVINPGGDRPVYYGAQDVSLSPLGQEEAKAAARYLAQFDLDCVVASPLSRAVYGAEQVLQLQSNDNLWLKIKEGLKELDRGVWCGKTFDEIGREAMNKFDACDESVTPDGGESFPALKERVLKARDETLEELSAGKAAAIVSHLQVTRCMLSEAKGIPTSGMAKLKIATASVTCIDYDMVTGTQTVHFESFKPGKCGVEFVWCNIIFLDESKWNFVNYVKLFIARLAPPLTWTLQISGCKPPKMLLIRSFIV